MKKATFTVLLPFLGNDMFAIKAYRDRGKLLFPDGTIIAALHYRHVPSGGKTTRSLVVTNLS